MKQHRIDRLIEARNLESSSADDAEVVSIWNAARREWTDANLAGLSMAGSFTHTYQAAFRAGTALLRSAGYRVRGAVGNHHYATFYAAGALGDSALEAAADALQGIRGGRHAALYGDEDEIDEDDLKKARAAAAQFIEMVHRRLSDDRPSIANELRKP